MLFILHALDDKQGEHQFICDMTSLELGFELLNRLVESGIVILKVQLHDTDSVIDLPVEAFDGSSFSPTLQELERDWQQVLAIPI